LGISLEVFKKGLTPVSIGVPFRVIEMERWNSDAFGSPISF